MKRNKVAAFLTMLALSAAGCGGGAPAPEQAATSVAAAPSKDAGPPPDAVVKQFLEAVKAADPLAADQLLTPAARAESEKSGMSVAPPGSPTATFEVGEVEYRKEDGETGAHVASKWSDVIEGETRTDTIVWILRKEAEGWRIAGMATKVFENEPPLILNFEDHASMQMKQAAVEAEMERRASGESATGASASDVQPAPIQEAKTQAKPAAPVNKLR
jgi:hypothetical protein